MTNNMFYNFGKKMNSKGKKEDNQRINGIAGSLFALILLASTLGTIYFEDSGANPWITWSFFTISLFVATWVLIGLKIAKQWEKAVVLRLGKFRGLYGPGLFWIIPIVDTITEWIDHRVMVSAFNAEKTLTKDTVPVDVDAVLFWVVWDAEKAALEVESYQSAITWASQTALREVIGSLALADILVGRAKMDEELQKIIDERTTPWGVSVQSVEIRDVVIPQELEDAMSRQAQAERERQARVILGESEMQIADSFAQASEAYKTNPTALHLRAMNMLFEGLKERGAMVIVPSSALDTMNLGGLSGIIAMGQQAEEKMKDQE